jgi:hypothetical protein
LKLVVAQFIKNICTMSVYNLRARPCRSGIISTDLPEKCRVTTIDLSATGCQRSILVTSAEYYCGQFVGIGQKECPDDVEWRHFLQLWMKIVTETPLPVGGSEILIVVEREENPYNTTAENTLTRHNNAIAQQIVHNLSCASKHVLVCQKLDFSQDMYWEPLAIIRGGLDPFEVLENETAT